MGMAQKLLAIQNEPKTTAQQMQTLVRAALVAHVVHIPPCQFSQFTLQLSTFGVSVGDKHHSAQFYNKATFLAARTVQGLDAKDLQVPLCGLGIPSSLALTFDGVPVGGKSLYGRHGSAEVICGAFVSPQDHRLHTRYFTWAVMDRGHKGPDVADWKLF